MTHRKDDGFDLDAALEGLIEKYGQEEIKKTPSKKRKDDGIVDLTGDEDLGSNKKVKKSTIVANEFNRPVAEAIMELAGLHFKNKDARKGGIIAYKILIGRFTSVCILTSFTSGVFSKAAKALRECETEIHTLKEAMALTGVGKGIATYVVEMIETGVIKKLEEVRAGYA